MSTEDLCSLLMDSGLSMVECRWQGVKLEESSSVDYRGESEIKRFGPLSHIRLNSTLRLDLVSVTVASVGMGIVKAQGEKIITERIVNGMMKQFRKRSAEISGMKILNEATSVNECDHFAGV
ncbi:unnamed protein product [Gongylonema pulchrum]|uniref:3-methyladenine DNA glycosidase n=1 Tax=Gongylonema pulchrum TaxID=637853 RepID=A0A183DYP5_9BILA|nr:unnamed protein product [Gongylonema pulchrum]